MRTRAIPTLLALLAAGCDGAPPAIDAGLDGGADAAPPVVRDAGTPPEDFDGFVEWQLAYGGIPGAALAIVTPDEVVRIGGYGFADLEAGRRVDEHTLFVMASISKPMAVVRAMQLVEEGLLDLDAPIGDYLGYPVVHPEHPEVAISVRTLLCHVSGLTDDYGALAEVTFVGDPPTEVDQFTRDYAVAGGALYGEGPWGPAPGTVRDYCNAGYGVIGAVLEAAGGASYREQTRTALFEPLGMDGAGWFLADVDAARLATPYGYNGRRFTALPHNGWSFYPATSLRISATGLARFARMILRGGELDGTRVVEESSVQEMLRVQYPDVRSNQQLGFYVQRLAGHSFTGHGGETFGGSTQLLIAEEGTHALLLITNSDAYIRARVPTLAQGEEAMDAILARMDAEVR